MLKIFDLTWFLCALYSQLEDGSLLYGVCQTLVNLTNSYDKPEVNETTEKMKELGKFAKVKMPEYDEKVGFHLEFAFTDELKMKYDIPVFQK